MLKPLFFLFLFFCVSQLYSQKLFYKSNGNIKDFDNNKISPNNIRAILTNNEKLLTDYIIGRTKKTIGNALLIVAPALLVGDLIARATTRYDFQNRDQKSYPTALTYFGLAALVVAIPTKIGFTKKIKSVVNECNRGSAITCNKSGKQKFDVVTNVYGTGMRLKLK